MMVGDLLDQFRQTSTTAALVTVEENAFSGPFDSPGGAGYNYGK